jgi:hypothetical protein
MPQCNHVIYGFFLLLEAPDAYHIETLVLKLITPGSLEHCQYSVTN